MSIRPIDVMKSQEVTQLRHYEKHKVEHEQVQIGRSFQNMIQAEHRKPTGTEKSENKEYRYDAKEKGQNSYSGSGSKRREKEKEQKQEIKEPARPGGIDILI